MTKSRFNYKRHRFPPEIIAHAVWLYCRVNLSFCEVEEMFLERGIGISYETIRRWVAKFGPAIMRELRRRRSQPGDIWHLDEVVVTIKGRKFWLRRAVDQNGVVLDEILQSRRNTAAAKRQLARLMKRHRRMPNASLPPNCDLTGPPNARLRRGSNIGLTKV